MLFWNTYDSNKYNKKRSRFRMMEMPEISGKKTK